MSEPTTLPAGLADLAPGPRLSALLWSVDPLQHNGFQMVELARAQYRQVCAEQARLLSFVDAIAHSGHGGPQAPPQRQASADGDADTDVGLALALSGGAARELVTLASTSLSRVPALHATMLAGEVDLPKLRMLTKELADVDDTAAAAIVDEVRPELPTTTIARLRHAVRRLALRIDPAAARARVERSEQRRAVRHGTYTGGTAALKGVNLPLEKAAAAWENINAIARATSAAGDPLHRSMDQLRADVYADLLAGVDPGQAGAATPAPRRGVVNLHVDLATLAGLTDEPGTIEGFGLVAADIARATARQLAGRAQWRFATTDEHGQLLAEGNLRYRPTLAQATFVVARDKTCRAPGCTRPARECDIDHVQDRDRSGQVTIDNMVSLCRRHYRAKHRGGHQARLDGSDLQWTTPRGHHYSSGDHEARASSRPTRARPTRIRVKQSAARRRRR